ncbi:hypothetical protein DCM90_07660 [Levilactobacillus bambusae]|uniref:Uncharacterized protein n=2 Tax=Levilactobacillus bambusae TaxID=2024736 RepID=A0A2V1MX88_9LACO|nr:hypothetical protein DCM90_07660 [Levilactobacillus bambusae]
MSKRHTVKFSLLMVLILTGLTGISVIVHDGQKVEAAKTKTVKTVKSTVNVNAKNSDDLSYLTTHGYALGVASNFNIFATESYTQDNDIGNARIAANKFQVNNYQRSVGWTQADPDIDSHMLAVKSLADDSNTQSTKLITDRTSGVFAAEDSGTTALRNSSGNPVDVDQLTNVKDFSENQLTNFASANDQVEAVSKFYASEDQINQTFSKKFVNNTTLTTDQLSQIHAGKTVTINDPNAERKCLVVNIPVDSVKDLKTQEDVLKLHLQYVTNLSAEPIVILNFPNLSKEDVLDLNSAGDIVDVSYGTVDHQTQIIDKNHLLLNFSQLKTIKFNNQFIGTVIAPNTDIEINALNSALTSVIGKNIHVATSINTLGPNGIFNPPDFSDPDNSANSDDKPSKSVETTLKKTGTDGQSTSTSFDNPTTMASAFTYNDKANFSLKWEAYEGTNLYESIGNQSSWKQVASSDGDGAGKFSTDQYPGQDQKLTQTSDADYVTLMTPKNQVVYFALASSDPNDSKTEKQWSSSITLNLAPFSISMPKKILFSNLAVQNGVTRPDPTPTMKLNNTLDAPFKLKVGVDAQSSVTEPVEKAANVFLGTANFTYNNVNLYDPGSDLGMTQSDADQFIKDLATDPLTDDGGKVYQMNDFQLKVPSNLLYTKATVGMLWQFSWFPSS